MNTIADDAALARALAASAGRLLLAARDSALLTGRPLGDAGDAVAHEWLCRALREQRPDDGLLSEEGDPGTPDRLTRSRVWIIDPLDGTREYSEGRSDWAVHIALAVDGVPTAAAVALPGLDTTLSTAGATPPAPPAGGTPRIAVSRSRPPRLAAAVAAAVGGELVPMGSAGYKAMAVLRGEVDAYLHAGGQYEWDSAAPVGVAAAAGLHVSRIDGSPLVYNQPDPTLPDLLVCRPELADLLLASIADAHSHHV
jgi:3'(2'), 5'-bisphosphate nucleotidase